MASAGLLRARDDIEEACFSCANRLIIVCQLPVPQVTNLSDLNSELFVLLFEKICGMAVPDLIPEPQNIEELAHNVQAVIDTLSLDLLAISLSHITGEDIVSGNMTSIQNLLEIFEGYLLYMSEASKPDTEAPKQQKVVEEDFAASESNGASFACGLCGYHRPVRQKNSSKSASFQIGLACICPMCHYNGKNGHMLNDSKEDAHVAVDNVDNIQSNECFFDNGYQPDHMSDELREGPLDDLSDQRKDDSLSSNSVTSVPHPTLIENGKLKPKFARVGLRSNQTGKGGPSLEFPQPSTSRGGEIPPSSPPAHSTSSSGSVPMNTVVFKGGIKQKSRLLSKSTLNLPGQNVEPRASKKFLPSRRKSKSLDDVYQTTGTDAELYDKATETENFIDEREENYKPRNRKLCKKTKDQNFQSGSGQPPLPFEELDVGDQYGQNFENRIRTFLEEHTKHKRRASQIKKTYMQALKRPVRKPITPVCRKSFLLPHFLRRKSPSHTTPKRLHTRTNSQRSARFRSARMPRAKEAAFIEELRAEFPGVYLSPASVRHMTDNYERQLMLMKKKVKEALQKKSQTQLQTEEAVKRQGILSEILKKEIHHGQHMNDLHEYNELDRKVKASSREARMQSARTKHYYDEFYVQMRKRMQKRNYKEEQLVKGVFEEGLNLQKEQVRMLREQLKEKEEKDGRHHKIYLDALENFYQTQFSMLAESLAVEKHDMQERAKAQKRVLNMMKRDFRSQMENEVRNLQEQIVKDNEDIHFREMDAELYREKMRDRFSAHPLRRL